MDTVQTNEALSRGAVSEPGVLPRLEALKEKRFVFRMNFGLNDLPAEPGLLLVRGARQYGKSTWLQQQIRQTIEEHGNGSAFYINGDELRDASSLVEAIRELLPLYNSGTTIRRLFIDEITAIGNWEKGLKILLDAGELRRVLVVTTGSKAVDLRRSSERLPGRKGKLDRTSYLFTPLSYAEFKRVCGSKLKKWTLPAYVLSGGSPVACGELAEHGRIPEYVIELTRDWLYGEFAAAGRSRSSLLGVMECLHRFGGTPVGQAKLAREAGLANNTVAAGYIELLDDLLCVATSHAWDITKKRASRRRPCKFHISNLLAAVAWHPGRIRSIDDYLGLPPEEQAKMLEWLLAQEIQRRRAIRGDDLSESMLFWSDKSHEIDFVLDSNTFVEAKIGKSGPMEYRWFSKLFPKGNLTVINKRRFDTERTRGVVLEDFLLADCSPFMKFVASCSSPLSGRFVRVGSLRGRRKRRLSVR